LSLVLPWLLAQTVAAGPPHAVAARVSSPPVIDGKLDDDAWRDATPTTAFTQKAPIEGAAPTERTIVRVVYDDDALYVGVDCEQPGAPVVARLTRRDREVEADWVSVALDTRRDGKSAFVFEVNAGGALLDGVRFNDTDFSPDWDENWEARVAVRAHGWSVEYRIPFRILRFQTLPMQSWGFEVRRYVSTKQETDEWALVSRRAGGEVSHYGKLDGLAGLSARTPFELRPFVLGRVRRQDATQVTVPTTGNGTFTGDLPGVTDFTPSAGLDVKWHPTQDLTLDGTINPDFAQVEADQLVLNLTTYETYYPEKRPFFLEGTDIFSTPGTLLYTRRIGRVPAIPALRAGEQLLDVPQPTTIWGASKLTGRVSDGLTIGTLQAVTAENTVPVRQVDGSVVSRRVAPLSAFNVARARYDIDDRTSLGVIASGVTRAEHSDQWPIVPGAPPQALCPETQPGARSTLMVAPGARCFNDAYVAAADWHWRSSNGDWASSGQVGASLLGRGPSRSVPDGTIVSPGDVGGSGGGYAGKEGGEHWVGDVWGGYSTRKFDMNDVGFNPRGNAYWDGFDVEYRTLVPWRAFLETHSRLEYWDNGNTNGLVLGRGGRVTTGGKLDNFWTYYVAINWDQGHYDDREMGDGAALERAGVVVGNEIRIQSDPTKVIAFNAHTLIEALTNGGINFSGNAGVTVRALAQLDLELLPTATYNRGEPRYVAGAGLVAGEYVFGHLEAASAGATLRATYTFSPRLTLQAYSQLFLASGHYTGFLSYQSDPNGPRPIVHLADLRPTQPPPMTNPDFQQGALDANVVLRWEWRLGSLLYLVYSRSQVPAVPLAPGEPGTLDVGSLKRAPAADLVILKLSYWWG
jgi:hypothetical protein